MCKSILALIKRLNTGKTSRYKAEYIDVWEEIDNFRRGFWLGGWYRHQYKTRPREHLEEEIRKEIEKERGEGGED
jgi:hypothetical protein